MEFSDFIRDLNLVDLLLEGGLFTWSNTHTPPSMSVLDRSLISLGWEEDFPESVQRLLPRPVSDHFPVLLDSGGIKTGRAPFRFENMWLKKEDFKDKVKTWWEDYSFEGRPSFIIACKLTALKEDLRAWNRQEFGDVGIRKKKSHR